MKKLFLLLSLFLISNCLPLLTQTITIFSPSGGEKWIAGSYHNITWTDSGCMYVSGFYSTNGGTNWIQIDGFSSLPNNHSYSWKIPNITSTNCNVKIVNAGDPSQIGIGGRFSIKAPKLNITITAPNGGEVWDAGSQHNISWYDNGISSVSGWYSTNSGNNWIPIIGFAGATNNHKFNWTVPGNFSKTCRIKVADATDNTRYDVSDGNFTINNTNKIEFDNNTSSSPSNKYSTSNKIFLEFKSDAYCLSFDLFDLIGNKIEKSLYDIEFSINYVMIDLGNLSRGTYYFRLENKVYLFYKL